MLYRQPAADGMNMVTTSSMYTPLLILATWLSPTSSITPTPDAECSQLTDFSNLDCIQGVRDQGVAWCEQSSNRLRCQLTCAGASAGLSDFHGPDCQRGVAVHGRRDWCSEEENRLLCQLTCVGTHNDDHDSDVLVDFDELDCAQGIASQGADWCEQDQNRLLCAQSCSDGCPGAVTVAPAAPTPSPTHVPTLPCNDFWPECTASSCDDHLAHWHCTATCAEHCRPTSAPTTTAPTTALPTAEPTGVPTDRPSLAPSSRPTSIPSAIPTSLPSLALTEPPATTLPTIAPSLTPATSGPSPTLSQSPASSHPTDAPVSSSPTVLPSDQPSLAPSSTSPTPAGQTFQPTVVQPTASPVGPMPGLFVSEVHSDRTDNAAPWQYIEIYNPTCNSVDLSPYWLRAAMAGAGTSAATRYQHINLGPGALAPGAVYTVCTDVGIDHWRDSADPAAYCQAFFAAGDVDMNGDDPVFFGRANTHLDSFGGLPSFSFSACGHAVDTLADPAPTYGFTRNRTRDHGITSVRDWDEENMFNPATGCEWTPHQAPADVAAVLATPGSHDCVMPRAAGCTGSPSAVSSLTTPSPTTLPTLLPTPSPTTLPTLLPTPSPTPSPTEPSAACCIAEELESEVSLGCAEVSSPEACGEDHEISSICPCTCCHVERSLCTIQVDLMFLLDTSRSVGRPRFANEVLPFVSSFAERFEIGVSQSRIGVATFSSRGQSRVEIPLNNSLTDTGLATMIADVPFSDGLSFVMDGLEVVLEHFQSHQRSTTDARSPQCAVPAALVVVLDGHHSLRYTESSPDYYRAIADAANELQVHGVRVFGVRLVPQSEEVDPLVTAPPQPSQMPSKIIQILGFGYNMTAEDARAARGRTYFEANPGELEALADSIATGVCNTADEELRQQANDDGCGQA